MFNFQFLAENIPIDMPAPFGFDTWLTFWMCFGIAVVNAFAMCFVGYRFLQVLQLSGYRSKGYWAWMRDTKFRFWGGLIVLSFLSAAALLMTNVLLSDFFKYKIMTYLGLVFYLVFLLMYIINMNAYPTKTPLKYTSRLVRLMIVQTVLVFVATFALVGVSDVHIPYFRFGMVALTPALLPLIIQLAHYITCPFETLNNKRYVKKAIAVLGCRKDLTVVGITGSYGKTTVKNMLSTMLGEKFSVCATPQSFNTPLGLSRTILHNLKSENTVLIAEMGARHEGDIAFLCNMVHPTIGVLTGIGNQHMSTFRDIETLMKTKNELADEVLKNNGKMFFAGDSAGSAELFEKYAGDRTLVSVENTNANVFATGVEVSEKGSTFVLHIGGKTANCKTQLLGKHNIANILLCCAVCDQMGLSINEIKRGISKLVPTAHRLAIVPSNNSLVVIDDAYNGNVAGCKAALEVLALFHGKKYVITPGLVELGKDEFNANFQFGRDMAAVCDKVIIDGVGNYEAIAAGLEFGGMEKENILRAATLSQATEVLATFAEPGDVVLFENDLPDNYV